MNYCYGNGVQSSALCWEVVPFSKVLYQRFHCILTACLATFLLFLQMGSYMAKIWGSVSWTICECNADLILAPF